jgi:hypothetical protein
MTLGFRYRTMTPLCAERATVILAQVNRETQMARVTGKEHEHHWEDGMEVSRLHSITHVYTDRQ